MRVYGGTILSRTLVTSESAQAQWLWLELTELFLPKLPMERQADTARPADTRVFPAA